MNPDTSIYTAEATAIGLALDLIDKSNKKSFIILSDSLSCLKALNSCDLSDSRILNLKQKIHLLSEKNKKIPFVWVPSHIGIEGNEQADATARKTLENKIIKGHKIPYTDFKSKIKKYIQNTWENDWKKEINNKLFKIISTIKPRKRLNLTRKDSVIYTRLKVGHTF